ncbi:MAG: PhzF family phenazine biosynthesis protein [Thermoanaerobaculia bacterium]
MSYQFHTVDVFTDRQFGGNQLAVLPDARGLSVEQMHSITREFNFSETVFVLPPENAANARRIRIFTPGKELPFAGHPTVGTAFVLAATGEIPLTGDETRIVLEEGVGPVDVLIKSSEGKPFFTELSAAKMPERGPGTYDRETIARALSLAPEDIDADGPYSIEGFTAGVPFVFVPIRSLEALGQARPKVELFEKALGGSWSPDLYLFCEREESRSKNGISNGDAVIQVRMFAPLLGVPEDPATGSAAAAFAGYLARRSSRKEGTLRYTIHQGVEMGRPSMLLVGADIAGGAVQAVRVGGASVLVCSGTLELK